MPDTILRDNLLQLARELEKLKRHTEQSILVRILFDIDDAIKILSDAEERIVIH